MKYASILPVLYTTVSFVAAVSFVNEILFSYFRLSIYRLKLIGKEVSCTRYATKLSLFQIWCLVLKGASISNIDLTHLLYAKQNFEFFCRFFATNFKILPLLYGKKFVCLFPAICCIPLVLRIIFESLICGCSC